MRLWWRLTLGFLLTAAIACQPSAPAFRNRDISQAAWGGDFSLTTQDQKPARLADYRGQVVLLFFGYTHCPDICSPTLGKLAAMRKQLGDAARNVRVIFVTVDPVHDTPQQLATFLAQFDSSFVGMTGTPAQTAAVAAQYKVAAHAAADATVDHSGSIFIIDRVGRIRLLANNDVGVDALVHDVRLLLKNG